MLERLLALWPVAMLGLAIVILLQILRGIRDRARVREQLFARTRTRTELPEELAGEAPDRYWGSWLERWLFVSGFRSEGVVGRFLTGQLLAVVLGMGVALALRATEVVSVGVEWLREIPGGIGDVLAPLLGAAPWILFVILSLLPISIVRSRRQAIVKDVERDLPMTLALLATLVESGAGFDAAVDRVTSAMDPRRPLASELQLFRSEARAGIPRLDCFRGLSRRLDIISVSTFVSAMIHSEQVGGGVSSSLRGQADEVWSRRRELAIQRAQTLPTKLSVPLVLCFLPGIFVYTFGPALAEFLRIAENVISGGAS